MNTDTKTILDELARTLLYEGYSLYPYRRSALKNKTPAPFGVLFPPQYCAYNTNTSDMIKTQCILHPAHNTSISVTVKFLQLVKTEIYPSDADTAAERIQLGTALYAGGWQAEEHEVCCGETDICGLLNTTRVFPYSLPERTDTEIITDEEGTVAAAMVHTCLEIKGIIAISASKIEDKDACIVTVELKNTTEFTDAQHSSRDDAMQHSPVSAHIILSANGGSFVSDQNPGDAWQETKDGLTNIRTWPVLIDEDAGTILSSPIILYDHPQVNAGSKGHLFDNTEMEEALWLHVNVLTDEEKSQMMHDSRTAEALSIAESLSPEELLNLHDKLKYL